jgi:thymidylate synthase
MQQYKELVKDVLENGFDSGDRTGTGTKSVFGRQLRFDLQKGFPLVTTKKTYWKGVLVELLWLMRGDTNVKFLQERGVTIWDEWADEKGDLGPVYGQQWRNWETIKRPDNEADAYYGNYSHKRKDQLKEAIQTIKNNPNSRRIIVNAWNVGEVDNMALPPCHTMFQFYVRDGKLSCQLYQRSADLFLGVPFNIASYAALTHLIANDAGLEVGEFVHTFGDVHIYNNHIDQCKTLLERDPLPLPKLEVHLERDDLMFFVDHKCHKMDWKELKEVVSLTGYTNHGKLKGEVSV